MAHSKTDNPAGFRRALVLALTLTGSLAMAGCDFEIFGPYAHQQRFDIQGTVTRRTNGKPVVGAGVSLTWNTGGLGFLSVRTDEGSIRAVSDNKGHYRIRAQLSFDFICGFSVAASYPGSDASKTTHVPCTDAAQTIDFQLERPWADGHI